MRGMDLHSVPSSLLDRSRTPDEQLDNLQPFRRVCQSPTLERPQYPTDDLACHTRAHVWPSDAWSDCWIPWRAGEALDRGRLDARVGDLSDQKRRLLIFRGCGHDCFAKSCESLDVVRRVVPETSVVRGSQLPRVDLDIACLGELCATLELGGEDLS